MVSTLTSIPSAGRHDLTVTPDQRLLLAQDGAAIRDEHFYSLARRRIEQQFGFRLSSALLDLLDIGLAVHFADRLARRRSAPRARQQLNWVRNINLTIHVRNPERWYNGKLRDLLCETLYFFTDDRWEFNFIQRVADPLERQGFLFDTRPQQPLTTALFSGGLDSIAGACLQLREWPQNHFVLLSAVTSPRTAAVQKILVRGIRARFGQRVTHLQVPFGLRQRQVTYDSDETSQRSRGFVFMVIGAIAAMAAGGSDVSVYENGIGSINLPITNAQLGSQSTRATDPRGLVRLSKLLSTITDRPFGFCNPFALSTKAQMCAALREDELKALASQSVSCDGFPQRFQSAVQCGLCTSCLLRRLSMSAGGLESHDPYDRYRHDVRSIALDASADQLYPWRAMLTQAEQIQRAVTAPEPWLALVRLHPQLFEVAAAEPSIVPNFAGGSVESQLISLFHRYCAEWISFPARPPA